MALSSHSLPVRIRNPMRWPSPPLNWPLPPVPSTSSLQVNSIGMEASSTSTGTADTPVG